MQSPSQAPVSPLPTIEEATPAQPAEVTAAKAPPAHIHRQTPPQLPMQSPSQAPEEEVTAANAPPADPNRQMPPPPPLQLPQMPVSPPPNHNPWESTPAQIDEITTRVANHVGRWDPHTQARAEQYDISSRAGDPPLLHEYLPDINGPYLFEYPKDIPKEYNRDWTYVHGDEETSWDRVLVQNEMVYENLTTGRAATFTSWGNSLSPLIPPGSQTCIVPITGDADVEQGDVVFCRCTSKMRGHEYLITHLVTQKTWTRNTHYRYHISRLDGATNDVLPIDLIYGKVRYVDNVPYDEVLDEYQRRSGSKLRYDWAQIPTAQN